MSDFFGWQTVHRRSHKMRCRKCGRRVWIAVVRFDARLSDPEVPALCTRCFEGIDPLEGKRLYRGESGEVVAE